MDLFYLKGILKLKKNGLSFDIVIVGSGLTGLFLSCICVKKGLRVAVIEKNDLSRYRPGEVLSPEVKRYFQVIGFTPSIYTTSECSGVSTIVDNKEINTKEYSSNPYGNATTINHSSLLEELVKYAKGLSVTFYQNSKIFNKHRSEGVWLIDLTDGHRVMTKIKTNFIVFATGKNSSNGGRRGSVLRYDRSVARVFVIDSQDLKINDRVLFIESFFDGWIYLKKVPGEKVVFSVISDSDLMQKTPQSVFGAYLEKSSLFNKISFSLNEFFALKSYGFDARTMIRTECFGDGWLSLGDNFYSIDPLSGMGILKNLEMASGFVDKFLNWIECSDQVGREFVFREFRRFMNFKNEGEMAYRDLAPAKTGEFWHRRLH